MAAVVFFVSGLLHLTQSAPAGSQVTTDRAARLLVKDGPKGHRNRHTSFVTVKHQAANLVCGTMGLRADPSWYYSSVGPLSDHDDTHGWSAGDREQRNARGRSAASSGHAEGRSRARRHLNCALLRMSVTAACTLGHSWGSCISGKALWSHLHAVQLQASRRSRCGCRYSADMMPAGG